MPTSHHGPLPKTTTRRCHSKKSAMNLTRVWWQKSLTFISGRPTHFFEKHSTSSTRGASATNPASSGSSHNSEWVTTGEFLTNTCCSAFEALSRLKTEHKEAGSSNDERSIAASHTASANSSRKSAPTPTSNSTAAKKSQTLNGLSTATRSSGGCSELS